MENMIQTHPTSLQESYTQKGFHSSCDWLSNCDLFIQKDLTETPKLEDKFPSAYSIYSCHEKPLQFILPSLIELLSRRYEDMFLMPALKQRYSIFTWYSYFKL